MIYITGATGHIGNNALRAFIQEKTPCELLLRKISPAIEDLNVTYHIGDIFSHEFLDQHLKPNDTLIHCAGVIDLTKRLRNESDLVNIEGTYKIVDYCTLHQIRLVYVSSVDAINKPKNTDPILEPTFFDLSKIKSHYAKSKALGTAYVLDKLNQGLLEGAIVYPAAVIGPHDYKPSAAGKEIMKAYRKPILPYIKGGYNFIDVRDVAKAIYHVSVYSMDGSYILAAHEHTIKEFYQTIAKVSNRSKLIIGFPRFIAKFGAIFFKDISNVMIDAILENYHYVNDRMVQLLKINPIPFKETVRDTIEWFNQNK
jgi:dihydroflavonol-4-reductase